MRTEEQESSIKILSDEDVRAEALRWVNELRGEYGLGPINDLPTGVRYAAGDCALANALRDLTDGSAKICGTRYGSANEFTFGRAGRVESKPVPDVVAEFGRRFDSGAYPDLTSETGLVLNF